MVETTFQIFNANNLGGKSVGETWKMSQESKSAVFESNDIIVKNDGKSNLVDKLGNNISKDYDYVEKLNSPLNNFYYASNKAWYATEPSQSFLLDVNGNELFAEPWFGIYFSSECKDICTVGNMKEFIEKNPRHIFSPNPQAQKVSTSEGFLKIYSNGKIGYVDKEGQIKIKPIYSELNDFKDGLAVAVNEEKGIKYIDKNGDIVINLENTKYDDYRNSSSNKKYLFHEGLAGFKILTKGEDSSAGKWGFINKKGDTIINPIYRSVTEFKSGVSVVSLYLELNSFNNEGLFGVIDKEGKYVVEPIYQEISGFNNGLADVKPVDGKTGKISTDGIFLPGYELQ